MNKIIITIFSLLAFILPSVVKAITVDYNNLLSDAEARNYTSMNQSQIQSFLVNNNSYLKHGTYFGNNPNPSQAKNNPEEKYFSRRPAAEIIYNASQEAKINPQFLLTMLQKEQSLIKQNNPSIRQLNYAMGYYCYDGQSCNPKWRGFGKQVRATALQFEDYLDNIHNYRFQPGKLSCVGDPNDSLPCTSNGTKVIPENKITASMYVYTPHIHGNKNFAIIWDDFGFKASSVSTPINDIVKGIYPHNSLVKAVDNNEEGNVYLIYNEKKLLFDSYSALVSRFDPQKILKISSEELEKYENGFNIKHTNYSVLEDGTGQKYLIDGLEKRALSDDVFKELGYNPAEVLVVDNEELSNFFIGEAIDSNNSSPLEQLLKDMSTNGVYYVKNGIKAPIVDPLIIEINYPNLTIQSATSESLEEYRKVTAVKLKDGNLIKQENDPRVYVISNSKRRAIPDEATFNGLGYDWSNILTVPERVLKLHKVGKPLSI